jgi:hypothetical protein
MRLFNVRLSDDDSAKVMELRRKGVSFADLVREAVRTKYVRRRRAEKPKDIRAALEAIYAKYPDPPDLPPRPVNTLDRRAMQKYIAEKVRSETRDYDPARHKRPRGTRGSSR